MDAKEIVEELDSRGWWRKGEGGGGGAVGERSNAALIGTRYS